MAPNGVRKDRQKKKNFNFINDTESLKTEKIYFIPFSRNKRKYRIGKSFV